MECGVRMRWSAELNAARRDANASATRHVAQVESAVENRLGRRGLARALPHLAAHADEVACPLLLSLSVAACEGLGLKVEMTWHIRIWSLNH